MVIDNPIFIEMEKYVKDLWYDKQVLDIDIHPFAVTVKISPDSGIYLEQLKNIEKYFDAKSIRIIVFNDGQDEYFEMQIDCDFFDKLLDSK
jgi:hypothetical protein